MIESSVRIDMHFDQIMTHLNQLQLQFQIKLKGSISAIKSCTTWVRTTCWYNF